ncbi:hypothetical protein [Pedobacter sp. MC2016-24]|uniref:hypothetical protein n=1 Tax=Pedobacter sp. MC2016-24 TaxID=2780090 RepID=UPI001882595F|nr:hypothetical protein [Pedobacter sp. MC2016-24]MBE9599521.1 hypothetical protein [Pedobacter sp. MC2016-24]
MNKYILKALRKIHSLYSNKVVLSGRNWNMFSNKEYSNDLIFKILMSDQPCMIARFGSTEMLSLVNYMGIKQNNRNWKDFITGKSLMWWWSPETIRQLQKWSGFFPAESSKVEDFCRLMINDISQVDVLGSWLNQEAYFESHLINAKKIVLEDLEPFFTSNPWTRALEGKKVLVVHPFAETIEMQYKKRKFLFENDLLPDFQLTTIKAVQSVAGEDTGFVDWFEALDSMKVQIDNADFDICIIGCGAYGFPLAAHVKRIGKKAIHMAGATQLLFGIKGKRWERFIVWPYANLFNEYWVRPGENERPKNASAVEDACYW